MGRNVLRPTVVVKYLQLRFKHFVSRYCERLARGLKRIFLQHSLLEAPDKALKHKRTGLVIC